MRILFLCVANSSRSQLAEGLARKHFPNDEIQSAGSHPGILNPFATAVMKEIGIDISNQRSKSIDDLPPSFVAGVDFVITLCSEEVCPIMLSEATRLHWPIADPASRSPLAENEMLARFRKARDAIADKLKGFQP